jgi:hypothetical protein
MSHKPRHIPSESRIPSYTSTGPADHAADTMKCPRTLSVVQRKLSLPVRDSESNANVTDPTYTIEQLANQVERLRGEVRTKNCEIDFLRSEIERERPLPPQGSHPQPGWAAPCSCSHRQGAATLGCGRKAPSCRFRGVGCCWVPLGALASMIY